MSISSFKEKCGNYLNMKCKQFIMYQVDIWLHYSHILCVKKNSLYFETTEISVTLGGCLINLLWGNI